MLTWVQNQTDAATGREPVLHDMVRGYENYRAGQHLRAISEIDYF
jgi:hypothetical protein